MIDLIYISYGAYQRKLLGSINYLSLSDVRQANKLFLSQLDDSTTQLQLGVHVHEYHTFVSFDQDQ